MKKQHEEAARRSCGESGFSLIEALAVIALTGALLAILSTVTGHWMVNWKTGFQRVQSADMLGLGIDRIAADVASAQYVSLGDAGARTFFEGTESSVTFVRSAIGPNAAAGLEIVRLSEEEDARGRVLVRSRAPFGLFTAKAVESGDVEFTNPIVLVRPPFRVSFAFAGHDRIWKDDWQDAKQLPDAVRITVRNALTDEILPLSTAATIRVNVAAECVQNQQTGCGGL
jgi:general secretion pathway protein J